MLRDVTRYSQTGSDALNYCISLYYCLFILCILIIYFLGYDHE